MKGFPRELRKKLAPVRLLGEGGMGKVFLARDRLLEREVAVKVMLEPDERLQARFRREAQVLAGISHPHVLHLFSYGVRESGEVYLVTQYVQGKALVDLIPMAEIRPLALQLASAFEEIHDAGLIHRDVKPHNIVVTAEGKAVLIDFGIAWDRGAPNLTRTGAVAGTGAYMAPELLTGAEATPAVDWFSLGVTLYETLEGIRPYDLRTLARIGRGKPVPEPALTQVEEDSPDGRLLRALLSRDPAGRPRCVADVRALLELDKDEDLAPTVSLEGGIALSSPMKRSTALERMATREVVGTPPSGRGALLAGAVVLGGLVIGMSSRPARAPPPPPPPVAAPAAPVPAVAAAPRLAAARAAAKLLEARHGRVEDRFLDQDPLMDAADPAFAPHLRAIGWTTGVPEAGDLVQLHQAFTAWLRALREAELVYEESAAGTPGGIPASAGAVLAPGSPPATRGSAAFDDPAVREAFHELGFGAVLHALEDLSYGHDAMLVPVHQVGTPYWQDLLMLTSRLQDDLSADLVIWPADATPPQVLALMAAADALRNWNGSRLPARRERCLAALPRARPGVERRDLARALLTVLASSTNDQSATGAERRAVLEAVLRALPEPREEGDVRVVARGFLEVLRGIRLRQPDFVLPLRLGSAYLEALDSSARGRALLPRLLRRAELLRDLSSSMTFGDRPAPDDARELVRLLAAKVR